MAMSLLPLYVEPVNVERSWPTMSYTVPSGNGGNPGEPRTSADGESHARQPTANSPGPIPFGHPVSRILGQRRAKECCVQDCCGRGKLFRYIGHLNRAAMAVGVTDILWELEDVARLAER